VRIGFLVPATFAVGNPGNGIAEQARRQADALERLGHTVIRLNPWEWQDERELDVLHFYLGGPDLLTVTQGRQLKRPGLMVFSPIIDSNQTFFSYRLAARLGALSPRLFTVPAVFQRQARDSDVVVCRSRHEQERMVQGLNIPRSKTAIVLNGCPPPPLDVDDLRGARETLGLPRDFVLHVSAFTQGRKNVVRLAQAAEQLDLPLVVAGRPTPGAILDELQRRAQRSDRLRILGFVDARTKMALYALCRVFCLPSSHEGTGLAALEAAAHGAALVITRNGGPKDYFLEHAEYVDPFDVNDIKLALKRAWDRPKTDALKEHIFNNLTWDHSARALEHVYRQGLTIKAAP
jgi:glycosyltransferase involved in cell wall biosynthesis